jgi:hypothetical protein
MFGAHLEIFDTTLTSELLRSLKELTALLLRRDVMPR